MLTISVIGTASLDKLHFGGQTVETVGGAGLYTALAAHKSGASVGLYAPKPNPVPESLQPAVERLTWLGPSVPPAELPRLEIAHHGGGQATLLDAAWGAEAQLTPANLPEPVTSAEIVHVAALSSGARQLAFVTALRAANPSLTISVGTYARLVYDETAAVQSLFEVADLFFMNENEATGLFGSVAAAQTRPGATLFVTLGERGALIIQGQTVTHLIGLPATELDPTGAGDTFCGATLAGLSQGLDPIDAAQQGGRWAAHMIGQPGPAGLW